MNEFITNEPDFEDLPSGVTVRLQRPKHPDHNQKWPDNLLFFRHGRSKRNHDRETAKAAGKSSDFTEEVRDHDTPLVPVGEMQSLALGVHLRSKFAMPHVGGPTNSRPFDVFYVSPYLRTRQTCDKICEGLGYTPHIIFDERIREIEFGAMDGLDRVGYKAKYPEEVRLKDKVGKYFYRPPGGESRPDVKLRARSFLDTVVRDCPGLNVGVVCHSVIVLVFRSLLEKWGEDDYLQVDKEDDVKNASLTHYAYETVASGRHHNWPHKKLVLQEYNSIYYKEEA